MAVVDDFVLPTHEIAKNHWQALLACSLPTRRFTRREMLGVERRTIEHRKHVCACFTRKRGRPRKPNILANQHADLDAAHLKHCGCVAMLKISFVVKNRVIRQIHLSINRLDLAATQHRCRVVEPSFIAPWQPHDSGKAGRQVRRQRFNFGFASRNKRRSQQQILRLIRAN